MRAMDSRRLVDWISTGILGFQGATLAFDLLNCTALSWLDVRMQGLSILAGLALEGSVNDRPSDRLQPGLSVSLQSRCLAVELRKIESPRL